MDLRDLDLNLLLVFREIYQQRQISSAAKRLRLTQSAVSNALARLRAATGDDVFVRTAAGMQPTPFAIGLAEPVATALAQLEQAFRPAQPFLPESSQRRFTIAVSDVGEMYFMPRLVQHCMQLAPRVEMAAVRLGSIDLRAEMEAGRVDLALGAFEDAPGTLFQRRLFRQSYVSMFHGGHPLAEGELTRERLATARHLVVTSMDSPYNNINAALADIGVDLEHAFRVPHFASVPYILSTTELVATVPQRLAERAAAPFGLRYADSPLGLPPLQTNMFWHRRYHQDEGGRWLRSLLVDLFLESSTSH